MLFRMFGGFFLLVSAFAVYLWHFHVTKGASVGLIAHNIDLLRYIAERAPQEMRLWALFHASNAVHVMFILEIVAVIWLITVPLAGVVHWVFSFVAPARLPGSFPPTETVSGHGNAKVKSPPVVMDDRSGGMRMGSGGHSQI